VLSRVKLEKIKDTFRRCRQASTAQSAVHQPRQAGGVREREDAVRGEGRPDVLSSGSRGPCSGKDAALRRARGPYGRMTDGVGARNSAVPLTFRFISRWGPA
jgi:hypothetical protein